MSCKHPLQRSFRSGGGEGDGKFVHICLDRHQKHARGMVHVQPSLAKHHPLRSCLKDAGTPSDDPAQWETRFLYLHSSKSLSASPFPCPQDQLLHFGLLHEAGSHPGRALRTRSQQKLQRWLVWGGMQTKALWVGAAFPETDYLQLLPASSPWRWIILLR